MHYIKKYLKTSPQSKATNGNVQRIERNVSSNISLYCSYYSFYSQKVLMAMYEKNINFEPIEVDIIRGEQYSSWFLEINPRGEIPVLKVNDSIVPDSTRILDYLELYLDSELPPLQHVTSDVKILDIINKFRELIEALPAGVITVGSFFHPHLVGRPKMPFILPVREILKSGDMSNSRNLRNLAEKYPKAKEILLYKAEIQDRKLGILTNEDEYLKVLGVVDQVFTEIEDQLKTQTEGNWLCCEHFTIADINLAVLLQRLWELGLEERFWSKGKRPNIDHYYEKVKMRESFKKSIPSLPFHLKMIIMSQPPMYIGIAATASIGVVMAMFFLTKKLIH